MNKTLPHPSFLTLLLLISFPAVNAVLYTPALPSLAEYFGVSNDAAQQTLMIFLLGYTLGQLLYGPFANRYGRIPAIFIGLSLQILASAACIAAAHFHSFDAFAWARFFAALGSGVGLKMTFTLVNEFYPPKEATQKVAYLILIFAIAPGLSVSIGGVLTTYFSWISCFYFLAAYGLFILYRCLQLPETKTTLDLNAFEPSHLINGYLSQVTNLRLLSAGALMGGCTAIIYLYSSLAPFIAINHYGMSSSAYGFASLIPSTGMLIGGLTSARLLKTRSTFQVLRLGIPLEILGVILLSVGLFMNWPVGLSLFFPVFVILAGNSLMYGNASALGLHATEDKAHGSAILNFLNMGIGTAAVSMLALITLPEKITLPLMASAACLIIIINFFWLKKHGKNDFTDSRT